MIVFIQGVGIVGLVLVCEFIKVGIDWLLVEWVSEIRFIGIGIILVSNVLMVLFSILDFDWLFCCGMLLVGINVYVYDGLMLMLMFFSLGGNFCGGLVLQCYELYVVLLEGLDELCIWVGVFIVQIFDGFDYECVILSDGIVYDCLLVVGVDGICLSV